jgi:hypothetical protein
VSAGFLVFKSATSHVDEIALRKTTLTGEVPMRPNLTLGKTAAFLGAAIASAFIASPARSQGCEPIRFSTPVSLGGEGQAYQRTREWQLTLAYRRLVSNEWFIGTKESSALAPGGRSPVFNIHTFVADVAYSFTDRLRARASLPVSIGSFSRVAADKALHEQNASGVGDLSVIAETWLFAPRTHRRGNIAVGLGLKAPTGSHKIGSQFHTATGAVDFPADQTIQPSDGGWGVLLQSEAFRQITERTFAYAFGSYMVSPKAHSDVPVTPNSTTYWSVPDVYSARVGAAFSVLPDHGLTMSLGGRVDGIPRRDLIGGGDDSTIKRTAYVLFADPGLSLTRGKGTFTLSVPYRLRVNRMKSVYERRTNGVNGGGFAKYLVFASYSHRM